MRTVTQLAQIKTEACTGCKTCEKVCPTMAISMHKNKAEVDWEKCFGCGNCEQRCPAYAIIMVKREEPARLFVNPMSVNRIEIDEICAKAKFNPKQIICYCTETRAEEVAAAIILGADTPEKISLGTGIRSGCKVECIQPILRLLEAAGIRPDRPDGWQWYGRTATAWDITDEVKEKYVRKGFHFKEDIRLLDKVAETGHFEKAVETRQFEKEMK